MLVADAGSDDVEPGDPKPPPSEEPAVVADAETPERLGSLFRLVGSVVAPTTLLTALLIYFGWAYSAAFVGHFGLNISLMGFTTQDYVISSVQVLFVPLTLAFTSLLVIAGVHSLLKTRLFVGPQARRRLRAAALVSALCGLVLFGIGLVAIFVVKGDAQFNLWYPLSFGAGAVLIAYASRLLARSAASPVSGAVRRSNPLLEVTGAFFLVALSLFWGATNYAAEVGETKAREAEARLAGDPEVVLYSKEALYLEAPGVGETSCAETAGGYRFRYDGLRLMIRSAGQYFFLPAASEGDGIAVAVPENDSVRLRFTRSTGGETPPGAAITCPPVQPSA